MGDICRIDISTLKSYKNDFDNEKDNFNNNIYNTFSNSYLNTCSNSYVSRIANSLQPFYEKINNGYDNIDKWWTSYNENIEGLESYLADSGSVGAITESSVRSSAIKLPELRKYSTNDLEGIITPYYASITEAGGFTFDTIDIVLDYSINEVTSLTANIISWTQNVNEWWEKDALPFIKKAATVIWDVLKSVGATIVTVVQSLVEGLLQFVEALVDFVALVGAVVATPVLFIGDIIFSLLGEVLGVEWEWQTTAMWDAVMGFVSTKYVTGWFDQLYENTEYGKWLVENTWGFETVRSIGNGVGYIAGVVVLTIATFGAGGVVVSGGAATTSAAVGAGSAALSGGAVTASAAAGTSVATNAMAVIAGVAGVGKGTQDAWADGAGLAEGLLAGTFQGVWEGLQFFIGGKISGLKLFGTDGVLKTVGTKEINTKLLNSFGQVVLDGTDGGVEGIVKPLIELIYKDGYKDENGNFVEFSEDSNFFERYNELFDDNGGWDNVFTQAFIGSFSSLLGEAFDLGKHFNKANKIKIDDDMISGVVDMDIDDDIISGIVDVGIDDNSLGSVDIDSKSIRSGDIDEYIKNIKEYNKNGISIEKYYKDSGINVIRLKDENAAATYLGDSKLYLLGKLDDLLNSNKISSKDLLTLKSIERQWKQSKVGDLKTADMINALSPYLNPDEINIWLDLANNGIVDKVASGYTPKQKASIYNYTNCGGFEINSYLLDTTLSGQRKKTRDIYKSFSALQDALSGCNGNKILNSADGSILDNLDSVIENAKYDDAIVSYRGVVELFDGSTKLDENDLRIGDKIHSSAYQSSSIIFEKCYGATRDDTNIILEVIVPPKSGSAAYIENVTGVSNYGQMEVLIKRNATMTVVGDTYKKVINGIEKTFVPVVVQ